MAPVWRYRDVCALDACGGVPPDAVFTRGQNCQFPPLHPERVRAWRRRARYSLDHLATLPGVVSTLRLVAAARARGRGRR